jgi:farnesyl diphosphate synthase
MEFSVWQEEKHNHINNCIAKSILSRGQTPTPLKEAMIYATQNGGKRIRALLVFATGEILNINGAILSNLACAIELIHAYSLVHDDLPSIDNDDLRRGQPSLHKAFDEGLAIITGDALQALAYQCIVNIGEDSDDPQLILDALELLLRSAGSEGMVGGQAIDIYNQNDLSESDLLTMYRLKTGLLIECAITMPALFDEESNSNKKTLIDCSIKLGQMFQLRDDLIEIIDETDSIGKPNNSDIKNGKRTYPAVFGVTQCKERLLDIVSNIDEQLRINHLSTSNFANIINSLKINLN